MKKRTGLQRIITRTAIAVISLGFFSHALQAQYALADQDLAEISEKYFQHIAHFEWDKSYGYLADDIIFKFPDGDTDTRTTFRGLAEVKVFWENYLEQSGNTQASFTNFVHIPIEVTEVNDIIGMTGSFVLSYFSAELSYGRSKANVRMHWATHFNADKKIDGIYAYYDRTPIIEAAKTNHLKAALESATDDQVVQIVKLESHLSEDALMTIAKTRAEKFKALSGLQQKYYVRLNDEGCYAGVYIWKSKKDMMSFKQSELAATIPQAYEIKAPPSIEVGEVLFQLRD